VLLFWFYITIPLVVLGRNIGRWLVAVCWFRCGYVFIIVGNLLVYNIMTSHKIDHELKSWVGLFQPIYDGTKTHDLRVMDRDYKVGDMCLLREYEPTTKTYTGRACLIEITYITSSKHSECAFSPISLHPATGILSIKKISVHGAFKINE
jgi:hypothetical protein